MKTQPVKTRRIPSAAVPPRPAMSAQISTRGFSKEALRLNPHLVATVQPSNIMTVTLPLPPKELSPNARVHWSKKGAAAKAYRFRAFQEAGQRTEGHQACTVRIQWFAKRALFPDPDNSLAQIKAGVDGIADSGFFGNDRNLTFLPIEFAKDAANPRVVMTFTAK